MSTPPVRVMFLSTSMGMGGADKQIAEIAARLVSRKYEVEVVSLTPLGEMGTDLASRGVPVFSLNLRRSDINTRRLFGLAAALRRRPPDILVTFMFHANVLGRLLAALIRVPVVISSIRNEYFGPRRRELLERSVQVFNEVTVTNSKVAAESLVRRGIVPGRKIRVIPNGIAVERLPSERSVSVTREILGVGEDLFVWLAVGRVHPQKDYANLIEGLSFLGEDVRDHVVLVAGQDTGIRKALEARALELGVAEKIRFLGTQRDIRGLLGVADGFVFSSAWEGLPNAVMEALACAVPVVATKVGGVPELVHHNQSGFLVPPKDPRALSLAMCQLMHASPKTRKEMGEYGYNHIRSNFEMGAVVQQWEALFEELSVNC